MSLIICLLSADKSGNKAIFNEIIKLEIDSYNLNIIEEYIITKNKKILEKIEEVPYSIIIKKKIL